ncbi:MAG: RNA methyltransferase, partial [Deferrisomatales bacterium]
GSVARAMANFGLSDLVLVNPAPGLFDDPLLDAMARTAAPLARSARVAASLAEALADTELALGFTARVGKRRADSLNLRPAVNRALAEAPGARLAAVFGREDSGLTTAELDLCHWFVRIPTSPQLPSLNLAQAVGVVAYELASARAAAAPQAPLARRSATVAEMEGFYGHLEGVLQEIGFIEEASPDRMMNQLRRLFSRRLPEPRDVRVLRGILSKVQWSLQRARGSGDRGAP